VGTRKTAIECVALELEERDWDICLQQTHGNANARGIRADHPDFCNAWSVAMRSKAGKRVGFTSR
jgi:hypothetical protein